MQESEKGEGVGMVTTPEMCISNINQKQRQLGK